MLSKLHLTLSLTTTLLLPSVLVAQTRQLTAPPGYLNKTGEWFGNSLGPANGRYQVGDGTAAGTKLTITRVDYRAQTYQPYSQYNGIGRLWTRVTLKMAETNVDRMTTTWSSNAIGATTEVFGAGIKWPTLQGTIKPAWGLVSFPFNKPWVYGGLNDLLFDFDFRGGRLLNGQPINRRPYYLDGVFTWGKTYRFVVPTIVPYKFKLPLCNDTSHGIAPNALAQIMMTIYAPSYFDRNKAGKADVQMTSIYTAPGAPVIGALTLGGNTKGIDLGARCNKLHVDLNKFVAFFPTRAGTGRGAATNFIPVGPYPYAASLAGLELWFQAAWADSKTGQFSLTLAGVSKLPPKNFNLRKQALIDNAGSPYLSRSTFQQTLPRLTVK